MNILRTTTFVFLSFVTAVLNLSAQDTVDNLIKVIEKDSIITIYQSKKLTDRLFVDRSSMPQKESSAQSAEAARIDAEAAAGVNQKIAGFRIQVFSDNNSRTAKNEARTKSHNISEAFPHLRTYVTYDAPYWRLRVGDFRSRTDAEEAAEEIKRHFPSYSREVRVVRDRINYSL